MKLKVKLLVNQTLHLRPWLVVNIYLRQLLIIATKCIIQWEEKNSEIRSRLLGSSYDFK